MVNRPPCMRSPRCTLFVPQRRSLVSLDRVVVKTRQLESELVASVEAKAKLTSENNQLTELLARSEQDRKELGAHLKQLKATLLPRVTKVCNDVV